MTPPQHCSARGTGWGKAVALGLVPLALYFLAFCLLTYPLITRFSTHLFCDHDDGLTNVWNIWWFHKAVTELHQNPWYTRYIHYPYGILLVGHSLNPLNAALCVPLLHFLTLTQAHNVIVVLTFVAGGWTAFLLCRAISGSYWGSLLGGFIFGFCNYHFAHAEGHLNVSSIEAIPLFVLFWYLLLTRPRIRYGVAASLSLFTVILCDYYHFFCAALAGLLMLLWFLGGNVPVIEAAWRESGLRLVPFMRHGVIREVRKRYQRPLCAFLLTGVPTWLAVVGVVLVTSTLDPYARGGHPPEAFSMDLFGLLIPGGHWRFAAWTSGFWSGLPGVIHESSVHLGFAVFALLLYAWWRRPRLPLPDRGLWFLLFGTFALLAMGPALQVWGTQLSWFPLPYTWAVTLFPPLANGGVPLRFAIMPALAAAVICSTALPALSRERSPARLLTPLLVGLMVFEYLPKPIPSTRIELPGAVVRLDTLPGKEAVLDENSELAMALYYQIHYDRPLVFGHVARTPRSTQRRDNKIRRLLYRKEYERLYPTYGVRYLLEPAGSHLELGRPTVRRIYGDDSGELYDLAPPGTGPVRPAHSQPARSDAP